MLLSPATFKSRREHGELILYPGHAPLADAAMAAEQEASLAEAQSTDSTIA